MSKIPANQNLAAEEYVKGQKELFKDRLINRPLFDKAKKLIKHELV